MKSTLLLLAAFAAAVAGAAVRCGTEKYDFAELKNELKVKNGDYNYTLKLCGTSSQKCPNDYDGVTTGMATQTNMPDHCYSLGQYPETGAEPNWTEGDETATLSLENGSPHDCPDGLPRKLTVLLKCDRNATDIQSTTFKVLPDTEPCATEYEISTCLACDGDKPCKGSLKGLQHNAIVKPEKQQNATVKEEKKDARYHANRLFDPVVFSLLCFLLVCVCTGIFTAWTWWVSRRKQSPNNYMTIGGGSEEV